MQKKVYCVGLTVVDVPLRPIPKTLFDMDRTHIDPVVWSTGGDAANVAIALHKLGVSSSLTGIVGHDPYGDFIIRRLGELGVDTGGIKRHPSINTAVSHILIETSGERHLLVPGSPLSGELTYSHVSEDMIADADLVYLGSSMNLKGMDNGGTAELFQKAHSLGKMTATDFGGKDEDRGDYWIKLLDPVLRGTDILMPSYREAVILTGKKDIPAIRDRLSGFGIKILIVKLGGEGCYITDFKNEWKLPTFPEFEVLDTTGAGDSFSAGFIRGLLSGWDLEASGLFANAVASFNVTKVGATAGVPDFDTAYRYVTEHCGGAGRFPVA
jgi:sugar/nucleoside kinase (ribokinase family)